MLEQLRAYDAGPWRVELLWRWSPSAETRWHVPLARRSRRVASLDAALALARAELATQPCRQDRSSARLLRTVATQLGVHRRLVLADASGRRRIPVRDEPGLRELARRYAGWSGEPPRAAGAHTDRAPVPCPASAANATSAPLALSDSAARAGTLSPAQQQVVAHPGGPALVLAVAGAGKTTTMVARVAALVAAGADPERILVTSFSRAAVEDVRRKLTASGVAALDTVEVRTFHSLAYRILADAERHATPAAASTLAEQTGSPPPDQVAARILDLVVRDWRETGHAHASAAQRLDREAFLDYRARCLAQLALPGGDELELPRAARALVRHPPPDPNEALHLPLLNAHEALRRKRGWRDYDDLVIDAWLTLQRQPALRERWQRRWSQRIVDECQDLNRAQVALLETLLDDAREVMLIGDDDQSIYGFRGSDPSLLHSLSTRLAATRYVLAHNYRTRPEPLAAAAGLIERLPGRLPKRLRAARPLGGCLTLEFARDAADEAERCVKRLQHAHREGFAWSDQALLVRRFAQTPALEAALLGAHVPYRLLGAADLMSQPITQAALAGLHLACVDSAPRHLRARAWRRWLSGLGVQATSAAARAQLLAGLGNGGIAALERAPQRPLHDQRRLVAASQALHAAAAQGARAGLEAASTALLPWPRYGREASILSAFTLALQRGAFGPADQSGAALLAALTLRRQQQRRAPAQVVLTSAHRSKGLEWDVVVVPGQSLGVFPVRDEPEERRLGYVAWTRARERLHLLCDATLPRSPFLVDADIDQLERLQRDLAWCRSGIGVGSCAERWARREARERFGLETLGTRDPRA